MTRKLKILLISVLFVVATVCVCAFAGCKVKYTVDELKEKYGLNAQVTYFLNSNDGSFNDNAFIKDLYFEAGQKPMNLGSDALISGSSDLKINDGFNFTGWYYVELDSAGKPLYANRTETYSDGDKYDVTKKMAITDKEYDFSKPLEDGEHVYVCGDFFKDVRLVQMLWCVEDVDGTDNSISYTEGGTTVTVEAGKEIAYGSQNIPKVGSLDDNTTALNTKFKGYTVEGFYQKVGETYVPFTGWPVKYPTTTNSEGKYDDVVLYVKMLKGDWEIVSTPDDVEMMFSIGGSFKYYIKQDIDGEGKEISHMQNGLSGTIWGSTAGHKLSNFVVKSTLGFHKDGAILGEIKAGAVVKDVSFENFTTEFEVENGMLQPNDVNVSFVANKIDNTAKIENVSISGSLVITLIGNGSVTSTTEDNWLFGNQDDKSYDKIKVLSATCTVKDEDGNVVKDGSGNDRIYTHTVENNDNQTEEL